MPGPKKRSVKPPANPPRRRPRPQPATLQPQDVPNEHGKRAASAPAPQEPAEAVGKSRWEGKAQELVVGHEVRARWAHDGQHYGAEIVEVMAAGLTYKVSFEKSPQQPDTEPVTAVVSRKNVLKTLNVQERPAAEITELQANSKVLARTPHTGKPDGGVWTPEVVQRSFDSLRDGPSVTIKFVDSDVCRDLPPSSVELLYVGSPVKRDRAGTAVYPHHNPAPEQQDKFVPLADPVSNRHNFAGTKGYAKKLVGTKEDGSKDIRNSTQWNNITVMETAAVLPPNNSAQSVVAQHDKMDGTLSTATGDAGVLVVFRSSDGHIVSFTVAETRVVWWQLSSFFGTCWMKVCLFSRREHVFAMESTHGRNNLLMKRIMCAKLRMGRKKATQYAVYEGSEEAFGAEENEIEADGEAVDAAENGKDGDHQDRQDGAQVTKEVVNVAEDEASGEDQQDDTLTTEEPGLFVEQVEQASLAETATTDGRSFLENQTQTEAEQGGVEAPAGNAEDPAAEGSDDGQPCARVENEAQADAAEDPIAEGGEYGQPNRPVKSDGEQASEK